MNYHDLITRCQSRVAWLQAELESGIWPESINQVNRGKIEALKEIILELNGQD